MKTSILSRILLFGAMLLWVLPSFAEDCPRCHGKGRVTIFPSTSNFGARGHKRKCPVCEEWVYPPHTDYCDVCGGSGVVQGKVSSAEARMQEQSAELLGYLEPAEYTTLLGLLESLREQPYYPPCSTCNGSTRCTICGGVPNYDLDATNICIACSGSGMCIACRGTGTGPLQYREPENKEQIIANIKLFFDSARKRMNEQNGISSSNEYGGGREKRNESVDDSSYYATENDASSNYYESQNRRYEADETEGDVERIDDDSWSFSDWALLCIGIIAVIVLLGKLFK